MDSTEKITSDNELMKQLSELINENKSLKEQLKNLEIRMSREDVLKGRTDEKAYEFTKKRDDYFFKYYYEKSNSGVFEMITRQTVKFRDLPFILRVESINCLAALRNDHYLDRDNFIKTVELIMQDVLEIIKAPTSWLYEHQLYDIMVRLRYWIDQFFQQESNESLTEFMEKTFIPFEEQLHQQLGYVIRND